MRSEVLFPKAWRAWQVSLVVASVCYGLAMARRGGFDGIDFARDVGLGVVALSAVTLPLTWLRFRWGDHHRPRSERERRLSVAAMIGLAPALACAPPGVSGALFGILEGKKDAGWYVYTFVLLVPISLAITFTIVLLTGLYLLGSFAAVGSLLVLGELMRQRFVPETRDTKRRRTNRT
jgi:undecaprenyl pyrophosphate phosphatase UppP